MPDYSTIKELVIDTCLAEGQFPPYEKLTSLVLQNFPNSKWKKAHYAWYKSKIKRGEIVVPDFEFSESEGGAASDIEVEESIVASLSLERDLHSYLARAVADIEEGLIIEPDGVEYKIDAGDIDILARDVSGRLVVIELKAGIAKDSALGQLLGYLGCLSISRKDTAIRGILVASDFEKRVVFAARALPHIKLVKYRLSFSFVSVE